MLPSAISRSATTVGLSFSQGTVGSAPLARRRARAAASNTSWKMFSTFGRQSSTVIRAMNLSGNQSCGGCKVYWKNAWFCRDLHPACRCYPSNGGPDGRSGQQFRQQRLEIRASGAETRGAAQDFEQLPDGGFEVVVDDHAVELGEMRHIGDR